MLHDLLLLAVAALAGGAAFLVYLVTTATALRLLDLASRKAQGEEVGHDAEEVVAT